MKTTLINAALVGSGGFFGASLRYLMGGLVHRKLPFATFPFGTLGVNLLGCLMLGLAVGMVESRQWFGPTFRTFAMIGLLGGFTTFSTFSFETFAMMRDSQFLRAAANVGLHMVLGLVLVWTGYALATSR